MPRWRPRRPQEPADRSPVFLQSDSATFCVEIILVPDCTFCCRRGRRRYCEDVLKGVAANKNGGPNAVWLKHGRNCGSAASPVEAGDSEASQAERIGEIDHILTDRRLLGHARMGGIQEASGSISSQIGNQCSVSGLRERRCDVVERVSVVGETVKKDDRESL